MQRTADPRHASCVRTCRASGRGPLIAIVGVRDMIDKPIRTPIHREKE